MFLRKNCSVRSDKFSRHTVSWLSCCIVCNAFHFEISGQIKSVSTPSYPCPYRYFINVSPIICVDSFLNSLEIFTCSVQRRPDQTRFNIEWKFSIFKTINLLVKSRLTLSISLIRFSEHNKRFRWRFLNRKQNFTFARYL